MFNSFVSSASRVLFRNSGRVGQAIVPYSLRAMSSLSQQFEEAKGRLNTLKEDPGNDVKLQLYALFKQSTVGKCNSSRPGVMDFVGRAKWDAWNGLGDLSKDDAQKKYIDTINGLAGAQPANKATPVAATGGYETLILTKEGGVGLITLNRPTKKNAITPTMYVELSKALKEISNDDSCTVAATTGAGDFYCSGNDLSNFTNWSKGSSPAEMAKNAAVLLEGFVASFIDFPKPLIGLINGPAVGISVTTLGLFDVVYASDRATFHTPFSSLGQSPEACSSYTFPQIMGPAKAQEVLLFNRKLTAQEACDRGLVSEVFPDSSFAGEAKRRLDVYGKLPPKSLVYGKQLSRDLIRQTLHDINKKECERLIERWQSKECMDALMAFFQRKSKM